MSKPNVIIYTDYLLPRSETFILYPAEAMTRYTPQYLGSRRVGGLDLPDDRWLVANGDGFSSRILQNIQIRLLGHNGVVRLLSKIKQLNPQILQAHHGHAAVNILPLARKLDIPFITFFHGYDATISHEVAMQTYYFRNYLDKRPHLYKQADIILARSEFLKQRLLEIGCPPEKLRVHYIGTDTRNYYEVPLENREKVVFFAGRFVEKKGIEYLVEAMYNVQQRHPDYKLVLAGKGVEQDRLLALATNRLSNVEYIGWLSYEDLHKRMSQVRIFCAPSVTAGTQDSESFGNVFIEANLQGTPVVSFEHGGIPEAVADGETGLLAPERDIEALTQHLLRLIEDDELWRKMSHQATERVLNQFDRWKQTAKLESLYDQLIEERRNKKATQ
ncbi:MAG: glycosyltransferase [Phototrophicaceae bacterium]